MNKKLMIFLLILGGVIFLGLILSKSRPLPAFACMGELTENFDCYESYYTALTERDLGGSLADLRDRYQKSSYAKSQCHQLIHVIGRTAALQFQNVPEAFSQGDSFCWSGYYHGLLESFVRRLGLQNLPAQINSICAGMPGRENYSFDYYNCVHGLGHGIMAVANHDLFSTLEFCDDLVGGWEQSSCWSGAFMENVIVDEMGSGHHGSAGQAPSAFRDDDPYYPCSAVADKYKNTCYLMQTSHMLKLAGEDFVKVFEWCRRLDEKYRDTCYQSLGRDASGHSVSDPEQTKKSCMLGGDSRERKNCVIGAVKDFISYHHDDVKAQQFCGLLAVDLKQTCLEAAADYYKRF